MEDLGENKYSTEELEGIYDAINENAVEQNNALPTLCAISEKLEIKYESLITKVKDLKEMKNNYKNKSVNLKIEMEDLERRIELENDELIKIEAENQFLNRLLNEKQTEMVEIVKNHSTASKQLSKKFKEAPLAYEPRALQVDMEKITKAIFDNETEIKIINDEISHLHFSFFEPTIEDIAMHSIEEVMADFEEADKLTANLIEEETSLKKYNENMRHEIKTTINIHQ